MAEGGAAGDVVRLEGYCNIQCLGRILWVHLLCCAFGGNIPPLTTWFLVFVRCPTLEEQKTEFVGCDGATSVVKGKPQSCS